MRIKSVQLFLILAGFSAFSSCLKDHPDDCINPPVNLSGNKGVYIANEGNFQFGNAKISYYDIESETVIEDLYQPANGVSLGDVCQSICSFNGKIYLVVNNSGKVVVVDPDTFVATDAIIGFNSPRYFLPLSNSKAYVSDLYANAIAIVDLSTNTISGHIPCPGWTEEMALVYGKAFITNQYRDKVYVINTAMDVMEDSIQVSYGPNSIVEDKNGRLWVLCGGDETKNTSAALYRINPVTMQTEQFFPFEDLSDKPWRLEINGTHDTLYFLNEGVFQMSISAGSLPGIPLIAANTENFYGVGIDPSSGIIYVADAIDYVQRGVIYRYRPDGTLINSFLAGIIPGDFYFN